MIYPICQEAYDMKNLSSIIVSLIQHSSNNKFSKDGNLDNSKGEKMISSQFP